jgi:hypothetical protein
MVRGRSAFTIQNAKGACSTHADSGISSGIQYDACETNELALAGERSRTGTFIIAPLD